MRMVRPMRRKLEFHIIKSYPFSNLNRDEYGTPKNFIFAGHPHGRISSQSLKRSWREYYKNEFDKDDISVRTRALPGEVREALIEAGKDEEFIDLAVEFVKSLFVSDNKDEDKDKEKKDDKKKKDTSDDNEKKDCITSQIVPYSPAEIALFKEEFCNLSVEDLKDAKKMKAFKKELTKHLADLGTPVDIALFGRMVTSSVMESPEASMQVAHAVSTHPIAIEQDIFTAVDDIITNNGAGMFGSGEYDSCAYYEYCCLDFDLLVKNLGGDEEKAREIVPYLIETIAYSNPSGKNTTTGTNILPSVVMIEKKSVPYNLVNAFATPTDWKKRKERETGNGNVYDSVKWLADECDKMQKKYGIDSERYWFSCFDIDCDSAQTVESFKELLDKAAALV